MRIVTISRFAISTVLPMGIFIGIFFLQLRLGYDVELVPLYMVSVAAFSWTMGLPGAIFSVLLATGLWYSGNVITGYHYDYAWAVYYNTGVRLVLFALLAFFILLFHRMVERHRQRMEVMRTLMNVCHGCGSLQGSDGRWVPVDQLTLPKNRSVCECPSCMEVARGPKPHR